MVAVLSQIVVPMPLVPFNLALLGVFLCGALLRKGAAFRVAKKPPKGCYTGHWGRGLLFQAL